MRGSSGLEILLLARCLSRLPVADRSRAAIGILSDAEVAAAHLRQTGKLHPHYGDGSLMARCHQLSPAPEPVAADCDFLDCIILSCEALIRHSSP